MHHRVSVAIKGNYFHCYAFDVRGKLFPIFSLQFLLLPCTERNRRLPVPSFFVCAHAVPFIHNHTKLRNNVSLPYYSFLFQRKWTWLFRGGVMSVSTLHFPYRVPKRLKHVYIY